MELKESEKQRLFWASFLALTAAGFGFVFRVMVMGEWGETISRDGHLLTQVEIGEIFGASLWPIAISMILFSMIVDKIGYKVSMMMAFVLQIVSVVITFKADSYGSLYLGSFFAGLGHGIIEAVINPVCASVYPEDKGTKFNILHAAWPFGIMAGGMFCLFTPTIAWQIKALYMLIPVAIYGILFIKCRFPVDARVKAGVPYGDMLKEFGALGMFIVSTLLFYEITRLITGGSPTLLWTSLIFGVVFGALFGVIVKGVGKLMFFFMCIIMVPLATTELGTDGWIKELMGPVLQADYSLDSGWASVAIAAIMMVLRFNAGVLLKRFSPPTVLLLSSVLSAAGLMALSMATGNMIIVAFILFAVGQTYYWPTILGFVSERFPRGGAMTLNSVSAVGLLSVGIIGGPILGVFQDGEVSKGIQEKFPSAYEAAQSQKSFFGYSYKVVDVAKVKEVVLAEAAPVAPTTSVEDLAPAIFDSAAPVNPDVATTETDTNAAAAFTEPTAATPVVDKAAREAEINAGVQEVVDGSKRGALFKASYFPISMFVFFLILAIYFKAIGGYKPVSLEEKKH